MDFRVWASMVYRVSFRESQGYKRNPVSGKKKQTNEANKQAKRKGREVGELGTGRADFELRLSLSSLL